MLKCKHIVGILKFMNRITSCSVEYEKINVRCIVSKKYLMSCIDSKKKIKAMLHEIF